MRLKIEGLTKNYGLLHVLDQLNLDLQGPGIYCLMAPSGSGKTTLFRLILGLEQPDSGRIRFDSNPIPPLFSAVFQENRLMEHLTPVENLKLTLGKAYSRDDLVTELIKLLPSESLTRPVSTMSGGMKRRLAFLRAMLAASRIVLLDEPFTGLDEAAKDLVIRYLLEHQNERLFIIATHNPQDAEKLGAARITLP